MIKTVQWLTNLEKGQRVVAILLIAVASLFTLLQVERSNYAKLQKEVVQRIDSCDAEKARMRLEMNETTTKFLTAQIEKLEESKRKLDSIMNSNNTIIEKNKKLLIRHVR